MHTSCTSAHLRKLSRASLVNWLDIVWPCPGLSTAPSPLPSSLASTYPRLALLFFGVTLAVGCIPLVSVSIFQCICCAWCLGLLESEVPFHPCSLAPPFQAPRRSWLGGGRSQGCYGHLLLMLEHCPAPPTGRQQCPSSSIGDEFKCG